MEYTDEQLSENVQSVIARTLRISPEEVRTDSGLGEELGAQSLNFMDIQFRLESDFKIKFYGGSILSVADGQEPRRFDGGSSGFR